MIKKLSVIFLLSLFCNGFVKAQPSEQLIIQKTDSLVKDSYNKGVFSGCVVMMHNGKEIFYTQLGYSDWQSKKEFSRNTLFNIGSLNKQFTEEMIHQLVHENKLAYTDKLTSYLNLFPSGQGGKITIQNLLDMKAGLGDYLQDKAFRELQFQDFSLSQLTELIKQEPLLFEPGTDQRYSNSGYVILGALIEKITGKSYEENLSERICKPLHLKTLFYKKSDIEKQLERATGTEIDLDGKKSTRDNLINSTPAGGAYATMNDLLVFTEAKLNNTLPSGKNYGNGTFAGGTPFWNSVISYSNTSGYSFVIMANMGEIADKLTPRIKSILNNEPFPEIELPFIRILNKVLHEKGIDFVKSNAASLAQQAGLPFDDRFLNFMGYEYLKIRKTEDALALFKINTELFPTVANTFDSLAEAYLSSGDKVNALKNYKIELQLNPTNQNAKESIERLQGEK